MTRRWCWLGCLLIASLTACSNEPEETTTQAEAPPSAAPAETASPATEPGAEAPAPVQYDEVIDTRRGEIAYSSEAHQLRVDTGSQSSVYRTSPISQSTNGGGRAAEAALAASLRYAGNIQSVNGAFVQEMGEQGNELVAVTYETSDSVPQAAAVYRDRFQRASMATYMVTVPQGDSEVVTFIAGMGPRRYRVVVSPGTAGARIEATQMYIHGAGSQEFVGGQGVLKTAAPAPAEPAATAPAPPA